MIGPGYIRRAWWAKPTSLEESGFASTEAFLQKLKTNLIIFLEGDDHDKPRKKEKRFLKTMGGDSYELTSLKSSIYSKSLCF